MAGGVNVTSQFSGDYTAYLNKAVLPLALKELAVYQFADKETLMEGYGNVWMATRYQRVPLPYAPLAEAVPPNGETMTIQQVQCVAQQWGDTITVSDVAQVMVMHNPYQQAKRLMAIQEAECYERNVFNALSGIAQVNYVNVRGSRANLVAGDVLDTTTVLRTVAALETLGARRYMGPENDNPKVDIGKGSGRLADQSPQRAPHYAAVTHPLVVADWSQNSTVILSRSYSAVNRLYNFEIGEWGGCRFVYTNMVPTWTGIALVAATPNGTGGTLATGTYTVQITGSDTQNQYESQIYQTTTAAVVSGGPGNTGSISVTMPSTAGYTYSAYISGVGVTTLANLATTSSSASPTVGPLAGMATQIPAGTTITLTGSGAAQSPPSAPATGITVYPTYVFGKGAYAVVTLQNVKHYDVRGADKSDPLDQRTLVGWKGMMGVCITNQQFLCRIESVSAFSATFG